MSGIKGMLESFRSWYRDSEEENYFKEEKHGILDYRKLRKKYNSLESERDLLRETIKDEVYKEFIKKLGEPIENERLRKENKRLRLQIKSLKEIIRESNS